MKASLEDSSLNGALIICTTSKHIFVTKDSVLCLPSFFSHCIFIIDTTLGYTHSNRNVSRFSGIFKQPLASFFCRIDGTLLRGAANRLASLSPRVNMELQASFDAVIVRHCRVSLPKKTKRTSIFASNMLMMLSLEEQYTAVAGILHFSIGFIWH